MEAKVKSAREFAGGKPVRFSRDGSRTRLSIPVQPEATIDYVVELETE